VSAKNFRKIPKFYDISRHSYKFIVDFEETAWVDSSELNHWMGGLRNATFDDLKELDASGKMLVQVMEQIENE